MTIKERQILEYIASKRGNPVHVDVLMQAYSLTEDQVIEMVKLINNETGVRMLALANKNKQILEVSGQCRKWLKDQNGNV